MAFTDPFEANTQKYRELLQKDNGEVPFEEIQEAEVIDHDSSFDFLENSTVRGLPPSAFLAIQKEKDKIALDQKKKEEASVMFNQLFTDLNNKYHLNISLDFDSFGQCINTIIEPTQKRAMELYISEAYSRFRVVLYAQYLQAIALLSSQILDPAYLLSDSMTYDQKLDTMDRLYQFMATMNEIYKEVNIPDPEVKLEQLSQNQRTTYDINDPKVREFMQAVFENVKTNK